MLKNNLLGFVQTTDLLTDYSGGLYFNGTRPSNRFYSTADGNPVAAGQSIAECKRVGMSNEPIVLTAGQSLYAALDINQSSSPVRGGCTVFGLKRSV